MTGPDPSRPIRLGFNARLLGWPDLRGWNRYAVELLAELPGCGVEPVLYADRPIHEAHRDRLGEAARSARVSPRMPYPAWEQGWLPWRCRVDRVDVLHSPFHFGLPWASPCPRVVTLHDAIDQAGPGPGARGDLRSRLHRWVARARAHRVVTVSEHARGELAGLLGIPDRKLVVIPEAADARFAVPPSGADRAAARRRVGAEGPYLFYVGGWEARKNLPFLVRAFADAAPEGVALVLAGGKGDQIGELERVAEGHGVRDRVRPVSFVEDALLPALYAEALAYAYPSRREGFGLQLCEAMAAGCPTLAARATSLPEVLGDGGATFGLDDPAELAGLIRRVASDPGYRADLSARARARSAAFSWRKTAERTAEVYRGLLRADAPAP